MTSLITIDVSEPTEQLLAVLAEHAAEAGEVAVQTVLSDGDFQVLVRVEEGSAKARVRIVRRIGVAA